MERAYTNAAGRHAKHINVGGGNIGGRTLKPGVYRWDTNVLVPSDVRLRGDRRSVWIFQISKSLIVSAGKSVHLSGRAGRVFWQIAGHASLGAHSHTEGVLLCKTQIEMKTGASINGRLLAQTQATLEMNRITAP
jgi:hypothetical protein